MKSFIDNVTEYINKTFVRLEDIEIIVPNKRTGTAILSSLCKHAEKISWAPKITPISSIFSKGSTVCIAENVILVYELYLAYKTVFCKDDLNDNTNFDDFYNFGETMLSDFDEIDKYLVDPHKLFRNIAEEKEIDVEFASYEKELIDTLQIFWKNVSAESLVNEKIKTLMLWEAMPDIYDRFKQQLHEKQIGYQGLMYRDFVENRMESTRFEASNYIFVGFSALNECEKSLFRHLRNISNMNNGKCLFFWDADKYYINDSNQEAGLFLRNNIKEFPLPSDFELCDSIKDIAKNKEVEIIEVPTPISQVKIVPELMKKFDKIDGNTAIVLGDEKLLIPLIYSLPSDKEINAEKEIMPESGYNITMGYPLSFTASANFVQIIMKLAMHRSENKTKSIVYLQRKDINAVIQHSFSHMAHGLKNDIKCISNILNESKIEFISIDSFRQHINKGSLFEYVFDTELMNKSFPEYVISTCRFVSEQIINGETYKTESDFMHKIITLFTSFSNALGEISFDKDKMYYKLMQSIIKQCNIPFEGKSENKMQILGFMETRSLDFDNIIMLSLNEDTFPKASTRESLIPYKLRKAFKMPSIEFQDSIFAYYFYRLLQRSKTIKMIYHTEGKVSHAEKSRFITQIEYELGLYEGKNGNVYHKSKSYEIHPAQPVTMEIDKSAHIDKIHKLLGCTQDNNKKGKTNGAYPNLINTYITCPMKFYFNYIEGLKEPENIGDDTSALDFGNLLHETCHFLYGNFIGKEILQSDYKDIKANIENAIVMAVKKVFKINNDDDLLKKAMSNVMIAPLRKYVHRIIDNDEKYAPFKILDLENTKYREEKKDDYQTKYKVGENTVVLKGILDRVDIKGDVIRVIDYKTSSITDDKKTYDERFWSAADFHSKEAAQVLIYSEIFSVLHPDKTIQPSIISVTNPNDYQLKHLIPRIGKDGKPGRMEKIGIDSYSGTKVLIQGKEINLRDDVNYNLRLILGELLDTKKKFTQTTNEDNCKYCPYKKLCNKQLVS